MCSEASQIEIRIEQLFKEMDIKGAYPKLWLIEYFDNLINEIDIKVEKIIIKLHKDIVLNSIENEDDQDQDLNLDEKIHKLNLIRETFIEQIQNCLTFNLENFEFISDEVNDELEQVLQNFKSEFKAKESNESLETEFKSNINKIQAMIFKKFCFLIKLPNHLNEEELGKNCMIYLNQFYNLTPCNKIGKLVIIDWFINKDDVNNYFDKYLYNHNPNDSYYECVPRMLCDLDKETLKLFALYSKIFEDINPTCDVFEMDLYTLYDQFTVLDGTITYFLGFSRIVENAFEDFKNLKKISLEDCNLSTIEENAFASMDSVESLNLGSNLIRVIKTNAFKGLNNLRELNLGNNLLKHVQQDLFSPLNKLEVLDLSENQLRLVSSGVFNGLNNLKELYLNANRVRRIENISFRNSSLSKLIKLDLKENATEFIDESSFDCLTSLESLNLAYNSLNSNICDKKVFNRLTNLKFLDVSFNYLDYINERVFYNLINLEELKLTMNKIKTIKSNYFSRLTNLKKLHLNSNKLEFIHPDSFANLKKLADLRILY